MAAVVATGWRWAPLLGFVAGAFLILGTLDHILIEVAQPNETHLFAWMVVRVMISVIGAVASVVATVQNYRHSSSLSTPRWFAFSVIVLASLSVGAILVAAIPQNTSAVGVSSDIRSTAPTITLNDFGGSTVRVKAGEIVAVQLDMLGVPGHTFDIDELNMHMPMSGNEVSLALFKAPLPGSYTFYCAPHYNKDTGIGMHGTLIVEP
jgi:plastocyanin